MTEREKNCTKTWLTKNILLCEWVEVRAVLRIAYSNQQSWPTIKSLGGTPLSCRSDPVLHECSDYSSLQD